MQAAAFLNTGTLLILCLGLVAFIFDTVGGVLFAKVLNLFLKKKINPMIGAAGISAFPMSARVINRMGLEEDNQNFLLMHAVGANVSGQIASVIAGGLILISWGDGMELNVERFLETLPIMGKGMLGIFVVTAVLILGVWVMNRLTSKKIETIHKTGGPGGSRRPAPGQRTALPGCGRLLFRAFVRILEALLQRLDPEVYQQDQRQEKQRRRHHGLLADDGQHRQHRANSQQHRLQPEEPGDGDGGAPLGGGVFHRRRIGGFRQRRIHGFAVVDPAGGQGAGRFPSGVGPKGFAPGAGLRPQGGRAVVQPVAAGRGILPEDKAAKAGLLEGPAGRERRSRSASFLPEVPAG